MSGKVSKPPQDGPALASQARVRTERVFLGWDWPAFALLTCLTFVALAQFLAYWLALESWAQHPVALAALTVLIAAVLASDQLRWFLLPLMRRPLPMTPGTRWRVGVATTFVPGAEPLDMLEETVRSLVAMDCAHDTWVLDEGDDPQVRGLCRRLGARHFSRKDLARYQAEAGTFCTRSKHGNYNAWLWEVGFQHYDIVVAFDPDHVPGPDYLARVIGYFEDPSIAYVQPAQVYYNQDASFIARGAAEETYAYYSSMQQASYAMGYPIITGCHNAHRVTALREVGGFAAHDADDLLLTQFYRAAGWQGVYVPEILARGLTPVDWDGYLTQQWRWARSVLDVKFRIYPGIAGKLPARTRVISFLHGLHYLQEGVLAFVGLMLLVATLVTGSTAALASLLAAEPLLLLGTLQLASFYRQRFYLDRRREWGLHWRASLLKLAKWPYFLVALLDVVLDKRVPYVMTRKVGTRARSRMLALPQILSGLMLCAAWVVGSLSHVDVPASAHAWTAIMLAFGLALVSTQYLRYPPPYVGGLRQAAERSSGASGS